MTAARPEAWKLAVNWPVEGAGGGEIDLGVTRHGLGAGWRSADGKRVWEGWLPHVDTQVSRAFTRGSLEHDVPFEQAGELRLRGQLDLHEMLQPAIQPGATLDYVRPPESVRLEFEAVGALSVRVGDRVPVTETLPGGRQRVRVEVAAAGRDWLPLELTARTAATNLALTASWSTAEDNRPRALPLRRFWVPWAKPVPAPGESGEEARPREIPEIAGGNWLRGQRLFMGDRLGCARCHALRGVGGKVGPDLSNLRYRDYASVRQDIEFPNAALNPDHLASQVELAGGDVQVARILADQGGQLTLADARGAVRSVARAEVKSVLPAPSSLMPEGLWGALNADEQRDLMTFLLTVPLEPHPVEPVLQGHAAPAPRKLSEYPGLFGLTGAGDRPVAGEGARVRVVLCASPKDPGHGMPGFHDYPLWRERWVKLLGMAEGVDVEAGDRWPSASQWAKADLVVFYHDNPVWAAEKAGDLDAFLGRGGGLVFLHWSMNAYRDLQPLKERLARAWGAGAKFRHGVESLAFLPHPVTRGFPGVGTGPAEPVTFTDEAYWNLPGDGAGTHTLATAREDGQAQPQVWLKESGKGRVMVCIPGHFTWTFDDPVYRMLLLRGLAWAAGQPLERWTELALVGARFEP